MPKPLRLLLVEGDEGDANLILTELRAGGFEPTWQRVETLTDLRQALATEPWDLLITDYRLPCGTALDAVAVWRESGLDIPFLVVSDAIGEEAVVAAMKAGAADCLLKSNPGRLVPVVERELREAEHRRQARAAATQKRDMDERLRLAAEVTQLGTFDFDLVADNIVPDERFLSILGLPPGTVLGSFQEALRVVYEPDRPFIEQSLAETLAGEPARTREFRIVRSDGTLRWAASKAYTECDAAGKPIRLLGVLQDIHDLKKAEEELRTNAERLHVLSRQLLGAQEAERRHIARELHDEIGQSLTAAIITLQMVQQNPAATPLAQDLAEAASLLDRTLQQIRTMSLELRPAMLDDLGLVPALKWHLDRVAQRTGLSIQLTAEGFPPRAPPDQETVCYRVVQEALTNIVRHANARRVQVEVRRFAGAVHLSITDNGTGFDVKGARSRVYGGTSLGLLSMEERVMLVGGSLQVQSAPGQGCRIFARLPLLSPRRSAEMGAEAPRREPNPPAPGR